MRPVSFFITHPYDIARRLLLKFSDYLPDSLYLKLIFREKMGYPLNLKNPKTFCEKLQWLKLYDRRPEYTMMVDKYAVKKYVADIIGEEYIIPTLGVWDKPEQIEWDKLPNQFVLKCTHDSGGLVICKDKAKLDKQAAINKLRESLHRDYYMAGREWPYKNVPRRIIAEKYMEDEKGELNDYKVFNFNGEPKIIQVDYNRFKGHLRNLYTAEWERINATICFPTDPQREFPKPEVFDELKKLCKQLSMGIPHVRSDFYIVDNKIFFGELTFYHGSGYERIEPDSFDKQLGDWIQLPIGNGGQNFDVEKE